MDTPVFLMHRASKCTDITEMAPHRSHTLNALMSKYVKRERQGAPGKTRACAAEKKGGGGSATVGIPYTR